MKNNDDIKDILEKSDKSNLEAPAGELAHLVSESEKNSGMNRNFWVIFLSGVSVALFMVAFGTGLQEGIKSNQENIQMYSLMEEIAEDFDQYELSSNGSYADFSL